MKQELTLFNYQELCQEEFMQPPLCNTGVQNPNSNIQVTIDWFECTFKNLTHEELLSKYNLTLYDVLEVSKGMHGYDTTFKIDENIKIMINSQDNQRDPNERMGTHLLMSGKGCREYESKYNWKYLFKLCVEENANISRIDIAFDSYCEDYFTVQRAKESLMNNTICTKSKSVLIHENRSVTKAEMMGETITIGKNNSDTQVCLYNKLLERNSADGNIPDDITSWYRCELRIRHSAAKNFVLLSYIHWDEFVPTACSVLYNYLDFKVNNGEDRKHRMKTVDWWRNFLETANKIQLSSKKKVSTIETKKAWLEKSVVKSLAMCVKADESEETPAIDLLNDYYNKGLNRITSLMDEHIINA